MGPSWWEITSLRTAGLPSLISAAAANASNAVLALKCRGKDKGMGMDKGNGDVTLGKSRVYGTFLFVPNY